MAKVGKFCLAKRVKVEWLFQLLFVQWYTWFPFLVVLFLSFLLHASYPLVPMVVLNSYTALSSLMTGPCTVAVVSSG